MNHDPFIYTIMTYMVIYLGIYILYNLFVNDDNNNEDQKIENTNIKNND
jgi:hypothetical protein